MKSKKILALATAALSATLFVSCTAQSNKVKFSENWYLDTTYDVQRDAVETLTYSVSFEPGSYADTQYRALRYNAGSYVTVLKSEYSEERETLVYRYTTTLTVSGEHECKTTGDIKSFTDSIVSEVVLTSAMQGLKPIYSKKTISSHTPSTVLEPQSIDECYKKFDYTVETTYENGEKGTSVQTVQNAEGNPTVTTTEFEPRNEDYTTVDNEQLFLALRGTSSLTSQKFNVYNDSWKISQLVGISASAETSEEFSFLMNGEQKTATIAYLPVTLSIQEKNSGSAQTLWIAKTTDRTNNVYRNVILSFSVPLYNAFGTFEYKLTEADFI